MQSIFDIPTTLALVSSCWNAAEHELRKSIEEKYHDADEEFITKAFYGEFAFSRFLNSDDQGKAEGVCSRLGEMRDSLAQSR